MLDVVVDGVAEDDQLHQRDADDQPHADVIAFELQQLFPGQGNQAFHDATFSVAAACCRASETNTSSSEGRAVMNGPSAVAYCAASLTADGCATRRSLVPKRYTSSIAGCAFAPGRMANGSSCGSTSRMRPTKPSFSSTGFPSAMIRP